jgi:hypothetical protein
MHSRWSHEERKKLNGPSSAKTDSVFNPHHGAWRHYLDNIAEKCAAPISVILGYVLPSLSLLFYTSPTTILIWLFFPLYVGTARAVVLWALKGYASRTVKGRIQTLHIGSSPDALVMVYGPAVILSVASHVWIIYRFFFVENDATPISHAALRFIEIDVVAMGATMAYWLMIEAGSRVMAAFILSSVMAGPGAGLCIAWILREGVVETGSVHGEGGRKRQ